MNSHKLLRTGGFASVLVVLILCTALLATGTTQEVGIGSVAGKARMSESGRPLANATIIFRPNFELPDLARGTRTASSDERGNFHFSSLPSGQYTVEAYSKAHTLEKAVVFVPESGSVVFDLELKPNQPYLDLYASQHVFTPEESGELHARGFAPEAAIEVDLFEVDMDAVLRKGSFAQVLSPLTQSSSSVDPDKSRDFKKVSALNWTIKTRDGEGVFDERISIPVLPPALYWVRARCGEKSEGTWLAISNIGLVTKFAGNRALAFVTNIKTGVAVPQARIQVFRSSALMDLGMTSSSGTLEFDYKANDSNTLFVATVGKSRAICSFYAYEDSTNTPTKIWTYTDRPIYRPGDEVHYKGIARILRGNSYALPAGGNVEVEVKDAEGSRISKQNLVLSPSGTFSGAFLTNKDIVGGYTLISKFQGQVDERWISVASYRKPDFKITVTPERPAYTLGEVVRIKVKCEYYFGGPVPGAKVNGTITRALLWDFFSEEDSDYESEESYGGDYVGDIESQTDAQGECILEFDTKTFSKNGRDMLQFENYDSRLTFDVEISESGEKFFTGSGSVKLIRGQYSLESAVDKNFVAPGEPIEVQLFATNSETGVPSGGLTVTCEYGMLRWAARTEEFLREGVQTLVTDANGKASLTLSPKRDGRFTIRASLKDSAGNTIRSEQFVYVWQQGGAGFGGPSPKVEVVLDKRQYKPGEQGFALIRSTASGASALVTIEAEKIYWSKVVPIQGNATSVEFPVAANFAPNAYLCVTLIHDKQLMDGSKRINVDLDKKLLQVSVTPDREVLKPREEVVYTIKTASSEGKPVPANVSLAVVDEAVFAIREDTDDIVKAFYPKRIHNVQTIYSFPELYLDGGDKSEVNVEMREKFEDTAAWFPNITTNAEGLATVRVKMPDNLTSWRATAIGISNDASVGKGTANVRVKKDLMVRLSAPAYLVQLDEIQVSALVNNDSGKTADVSVQIEAEGVEVMGDKGAVITVAPGEPQQISWRVRALQPGRAALMVSAHISGGIQDAMRLTIPIAPHGRPQLSFRTGSFTGNATLDVDRLVQSSTGTVRLNITPTIASALLSALPDLVDYPYGCTEQTMSRFMPAVIVAKTLTDLGISREELFTKIREVSRQSMIRLRSLQHSDGSFGWFKGDTGEPYLTAYVLEGLWLAKAAGFVDGEGISEAARKWAIANLETSSEEPKDDQTPGGRLRIQQWRRDKVYLAYAVLLYGENKDALDLLHSFSDADLDPASLAFRAMAAMRRGDNSRAQKCVQTLLTRATVQQNLIYWPEEWGIEQTARAFQALVEFNAGDARLAKIIRYLMLARKGTSWVSTRDSAIALIGLNGYLRKTRELSANFTLNIGIANEVVESLQVTPSNVLKTNTTFEWPIARFPNGTSQISMSSTGTGTIYYSLEVRQTPFEKQIGVMVNQSGLVLHRTYHSLSAERMEDGTLRLLPSTRPETSFTSGQAVRCMIEVNADRDFEFVMIEVPTPSNMRVAENEDPELWDWWWSGWSVFDDRIVVFCRNVTKGKQRIEFNLRAESPGSCQALPVMAYEMYAPENRGSTAGETIEVRK